MYKVVLFKKEEIICREKILRQHLKGKISAAEKKIEMVDWDTVAWVFLKNGSPQPLF